MSIRRQHPRPAGPLRGLAAALLLCAGLTGCTALQSPSAAPSEEAAEVPRVPMLGDTELDAGTYLITRFAVPFEITVPDGWVYHADNGLLEGEDAFVKFDRATHVPVDACGWSAPLPEAGPSVTDLADALAAAESTTTTAPIEVEVDGYRGVEFDLSIESGVDIEECRERHVCIHSEVDYGCGRYYHEGVDQRETFRILDLDGDRAVMTVGQWEKDVAPARLEDARAVFDSITFVDG